MASNQIRLSKGDRVFHFINLLVMLFLIVITIYPMLYVLFCSFSDPGQLAKADGLLFAPAGFSLRGYNSVLTSRNIWLGYRNTVFYTICGTLISMAFTILGAYPLSRKGLMLKQPLMVFIMITMFFSGGMIPSYLIVRQLGMVNSAWAMILPGALSTYNMIVLRTSFQGIPDSLFESAYLDGAGDFRVLFKIVLPISLPSLATITLFYSVGLWSSWYPALVYLQGRRDLYPLQMFLRELLITGDYDDATFAASMYGVGTDTVLMKEVIKYATIIVSTAPILIVYPFLQKYFVSGVMLGSIKE